MAHLTSPAGRALGRPARFCPEPRHLWNIMPGVGFGRCPTSSPANRLEQVPAAAAAAAARPAVRAVAAAAAAAAVVAPAPTASCTASCGSGAGAAGWAVLGMSAGTLFSVSSALMVPVYGMLAFFPRLKLVRALLLNSSALYVGLSLLYGAVLAGAWQAGLGAALASVAGSLPSAATTAAASGSSGLAAAIDLSPLARMFSSPLITLLSWLHLLALDALMARAIALDGLRSCTPTAHSVLLCFFFGPTGLLSHAITCLLLRRGRASS
ncbi:hypothetical protein PLESTB_000008400 [Pleodorina starrii]|uniref:Uncharacterized protein n=1 Tax=Pleodorina starrii TaxID=330485 RepID=A0A9W6EWS6_9CHLO|nr:hypothetical protein PLESTM_000838800 [Pleodorina starrii]GLC47625.1 hypothetical protein PLESTB_000008400 [Pleodorina starrii]GLC75633.1 hypothetical protein PLESTF_001667400 [Pleodorina starrii]